MLKFIRYLPAREGRVERMRRSIEGFDSKNIVRIFETFLFEELGRKYLVVVTEYFSRGSLMRRIKNRKWDYEDKMKAMFHTAVGLQYLHERGIAHRNIKPQNVFRWDNISKLGDFAVAKELDGSHMTSGVAPYMHMAPEMYERDEYGL